jgi:hypothetical protein
MQILYIVSEEQAASIFSKAKANGQAARKVVSQIHRRGSLL